MATVSLQMVFDEAHRALEAGAADKAIGIAQHILVHYPRMIEGYRLLGEAHLNANQPEPAAAAFERVLQADPENVAAYYGLGLARQSLDQRGAAITAFERALEIQPNLADLRTQLMRLYAETPGSAGQFRLSRAGLGRLYARGGMYGQAIDEFRAVLDTDPNRDDVKAALAEAFWRDGQEDEAIEFCRDVLERQPELLKPTVLLGYLLFATGQPEGETMWRRAAERDAAMMLARSLFDILPPIRLEEPVLPEFDEAEWRAKEARRATEQAVPAVAVVATTADDDFFADSWLSSAGAAPPSEQNTRIYDAEPTMSFGGGDEDNDDDLLASLLGFGSAEPAPAPASNTRSFDQAQPFNFDWDDDTPSGAPSINEPLPPSLDDVGLRDTETSQRSNADVSGVQPFSFDDWGLDSDLPTTPTPGPTAADDDLDFPDIEAFSLDDDTSGRGGKVQPFSFETEDTAPGVKPFALDDDMGDFSGLAPFSFEEEGSTVSTGNASAPSDAGLGDVQPFSLDDWGLDDAASSGGLQPLTTGDLSDAEDKDDFGGFKPFSLDELSLDSLDDESSNPLTGPQFSSPDEENEEPPGFSWQEPSWRNQTAQSERSESIEGESIFAKLMRNRPAEPTPQVPEPTEESAESEPLSFFSLDDEPLRLDAEQDQGPGDWFANVDTTPAEPSQPDLTTSAQGLPSPEELRETELPGADSASFLSLDELESEQGFSWPAETGQPTEESLPSESASFFSLEDLESEQGFSWPAAETGQPTEESPTSESANIFSLEDLESEQGFSWETRDAAQPPDTSAEQGMEPFSLSDLGLSDDELSVLNIQPEASEGMPSDQEESEMLPFSLSDLGLSDDEIAALDLQDSAPPTPEPAVSEAPALPDAMRSDISDTAAQPVDAASAQEPDLTPFSLADLGLNDEELAFLEQVQAEQETGADAEPAREGSILEQANDEFDALFADLDMTLPADEPDTVTEQSDSELDALFADFDMPVAAEAEAAAPARDEPATWEAALPETVAPTFGEDVFGDLQLNEAAEEPSGPVAGAQDTPPQEPDMTPFSLADLGLSDEELAFFEQAQAEQHSAQPETADVVLPAAEVEDTTAFWPELQDSAEAVEEPEPTMEPFDSPFAFVDLEAGSPFASADQPVAEQVSELSSPAPTASEDVWPGDTHTAEHALPMDLPEGAQSVASAAEEYHPVQAQAAVPATSSVVAHAGSGGDMAAIQGLLESDPDNDSMRLAVARMSQQTGDFGQAMEHYKQLIKRASLLDEVVVDLQDTIDDADDPQMLRRLHRLLGDAYMKQNRFREAMDEYSWTLARSK